MCNLLVVIHFYVFRFLIVLSFKSVVPNLVDCNLWSVAMHADITLMFTA